jgi:hypothetical protein
VMHRGKAESNLAPTPSKRKIGTGDVMHRSGPGGGGPGPYDPCPPGTTWDSGKNECVGGPVRLSVPAGTFKRSRPGTYPVRERATGRTVAVILVRADGSGEIPVRLFRKKAGGGEGSDCESVCTAADSCFKFVPLPVDATYFTTMEEDTSIVCNARLNVSTEAK